MSDLASGLAHPPRGVVHVVLLHQPLALRDGFDINRLCGYVLVPVRNERMILAHALVGAERPLTELDFMSTILAGHIARVLCGQHRDSPMRYGCLHVEQVRKNVSRTGPRSADSTRRNGLSIKRRSITEAFAPESVR